MVDKRFLLIGAASLVLGATVYFAKGVLIRAFSDSINFLGGLSAEINANAPLGKESAGAILSANSSGSAAATTKNCSFETSDAPERNSVILNEIAWMGTAESAKNEWIELKNVSSGTTDVGGWSLLNQNKKIKIVFGGVTKIPPGGLYLLGAEKSIGTGVGADLVYRGTLRNSGDGLRLFDADCRLADEVVASTSWPAGNDATKKTMERDPETLAWHTSAILGGTPKKENTPVPKPSTTATIKETVRAIVLPPSIPATNTTPNQAMPNQPLAENAQPPLCSANSPRTFSRLVLINEVAWSGSASDKTSNEWIELKNNSGADVSLNGWQIQNAGQNVKVFFGASDSVPQGSFYLLERGAIDFLSGIKADKFFTNAVKNSGDAVRLFDANCNVVDEIVADVGAGENWPAGTASPDYRTAERSHDLSWHTYGGSGTNGVMGTPRAENSSPPAAATNANQAQFPQPAYYALKIFKSGSGAGSLESNPAGIFCVGSCLNASGSFAAGTSVTLTALADDGSEFAAWSGDCSGHSTCLLQMNGDKSATAAFNQIVSSAPPVSPSSDSSTPSTSIAASQPATRSNVNHILISQVQITGGAGQTTNDFVEIYNPTGGKFNLKGYRLVKRAQTGISDALIKSWTADAFIPAYGFYLWTNSDYLAIPATPDATTTASIADNNGVAIRYGANDTGAIIDGVAWGSAQNAFIESSPFSANPGANQSLLRKGWQSNCLAASYDAGVGNGCDTDSNVSDFELNPNSQPRNSQSK